MKKLMLVVTMASVALMGAWAQEAAKEEPKADAPEVTLTGEVVELSCFLKGQRGEKHAKCGTTCAENGMPIGFVAKEADDKEQYYQVIFADGTAPIDVFIDLIGQEVDVTGKVIEKAGAKFIIAADDTAVEGGDSWLPTNVGGSSTQ
jgi:hypothetical protein